MCEKAYGHDPVVSVTGLGGSALICVLFPLFTPTLAFVLQMTCLLGLCCGIAFGSSYQLVSHFSVTCNMALTIGKTFHISQQVAVVLWLFGIFCGKSAVAVAVHHVPVGTSCCSLSIWQAFPDFVCHPRASTCAEKLRSG